jgi:hypothetical protein
VRIATEDGDANFNGLKAPLKLSIRHFQRVFYTYRRLCWPAPEVRRRFLENRRPRGCRCELPLRIGDPKLNALKAPLSLSIRRFQRVFHTNRGPFWPAAAVRRRFLENRRPRGCRCELPLRIGDPKLNGLKALLSLSIRHFQRVFHTYRRPFWPAPEVRRRFLENPRPRGLSMRIGDPKLNPLKAPLSLSIRHFQRVFWTYSIALYQAPEARRRFLENRRPRGCRGELPLRWRSEFEAIESTVHPIKKALSGSLLHI